MTSRESVTQYVPGEVASAYVLRAGQDPLRVTGPVQGVDALQQRVRIRDRWHAVAQCWHPIDPASVTGGMAYGTPLWGFMVQDPRGGGGYVGEIVWGSFGGYRWTSLGRLVVCMWTSERSEPIGNVEVPGEDYRRIHVEYVAAR